MKPRVYLAGPIMGLDRAAANDWRDHFADRLSDIGVVGVSPLRCEPLVGDYYGQNEYEDPRFGTARAIASKNKLDVKMCDMTLCYFPDWAKFSKGTCGELFWANAYEKPTILVSTLPDVVDHPVMQAAASWVLADLNEAFDVISGVLSVYAGG